MRRRCVNRYVETDAKLEGGRNRRYDHALPVGWRRPVRVLPIVSLAIAALQIPEAVTGCPAMCA